MKKGIIFLMLILVLFACNSDKNPVIPIKKPEKETGHSLEIIAKNWSFHQQIYTVPSGKVTIELKNTEGFHGIHIEGTDITIEGDGTYTANLQPGEYTIVCSIVCGTGHDMMEAKLIVED